MKKKITAVALIVALLAIALIGGTMAYFTDTKDVTNTFTAGNVKITLDEAKVTKNADGDLVADRDNRTSETEKTQSYKLFPGMTVFKDPTITVAADSEDAWIGAKITIKGDLHSLYGVAGYDNLDISKFVSGGLTAQDAEQEFNWNGLSMVYKTSDLVIYQDASGKANNTWVMYVFMNNIKKANDTMVLFDTITVNAEFDKDEMAKLNGATVEVKAFATQANGFKDCFTAMTTAFPSDFNLIKGAE